METKNITVRKGDETLFHLIKNGASLPTKEQEHEIIAHVQQGDQDAEEELKQVYTRFVASTARQYLDKGLNTDELLKAGFKGLVNAGHKYEDSLGVKFLPYAICWIRQSIQEALKECVSEQK